MKKSLMLQTIKIIWGNYLSRKSKIIWVRMLLLTVLSLGIYHVEPLIITSAIRNLDDKNHIQKLLMLMAGLIILHGFIKYLYMQQRERQGGEDFLQMRVRISEKIWKHKSVRQVTGSKDDFSVSYIEKLLSRMEETINRLRFGAANEFISLVISFGFLLAIEWRAALIIAVFLVIHVRWALWSNKKIHEPTMQVEEKLQTISKLLTERWHGPQLLMRTGRVDQELSSLEDQISDTVRDDYKIWTWYGKHSEARLTLGALFLVGTLYFLTHFGLTGEKAILIFPVYMYMQTVVNKVWRIDEIQRFMSRFTPTIQRGHKMADVPSEIAVAQNGLRFHPSQFEQLEFRNVTYVTDEKAILENLSFTLSRGDSVGVFGSSGSGKTTIMKLIQRQMDPTDGQILLNGVDIRQYNLDDWRSSLGIVSQDSTIYSGTFRSVLLYSASTRVRDLVTDEEMLEILNHVGLREKLTADDLDTKVLGDGVNLSGGEAQRLLIAGILLRLLHNDVGLLLLDEATSALDERSQKIVQQAIDSMQSRQASFTIAHRMSTLRECNKFFGLIPCSQVNGGKQLEVVRGSLADVRATSTVFARIHTM